MGKETTWIVIADPRRARIFELLDSGTGVTAAIARHQMLAHMRTQDIPRRLAGSHLMRDFERVGVGEATGIAECDEKIFAREIVSHLDDQLAGRSFDRLIVVAPPDFLVEIHSLLPDRLRLRVSREIDKDLSTVKRRDLGNHLISILQR